MTAFEDMTDLFNTNGALGDSVSVLGGAMGSSFNVQNLLDQDIIALSRSYFNGSPSWSLDGWAEYLAGNSALSTVTVSSYNTAESGIAEFTFDLSGQKQLLAWSYDLGTAFEQWDFDALGFSTEGNLSISVDATFSGSLTIGVDLNEILGVPKGFFVADAEVSLDMSFSGSTPLDITLDMFSLQTGTITGQGVQIAVSLVDPDSSGRIYTDELASGGASLVSASFDASTATLEVPLELTATPGVTIEPFTVDPVLGMTSDDFVLSSELVVGDSTLGQLVQGTAVSPQAIATGFLQLAQYMGGVQSVDMMRQDLPFVSGERVGGILDIPLAITEGINSNVLTVDGDTGAVTPLFGGFGDLATALSGLQDLIHVDPNTRELTIDFDYEYDFTAFDSELTFSAGVAGLDLSTSSDISLDGSVLMQSTFGVQFAPDQGLHVLPAGQNAATETPGAGILNGRLGSDANFTIYLDGWDDYEVTVTAGATSTNANLLDLVADANTALSSAGLGGEVEAYLVDYNTLGREVEADDFNNPDYEGTGMVSFRTVTSGEYWALRVHVDAGDPANTLMGYPEDLSAKPGLLEFFIDDTSIGTTVTLSAADIAATGSFLVSHYSCMAGIVSHSQSDQG